MNKEAFFKALKNAPALEETDCADYDSVKVVARFFAPWHVASWAITEFDEKTGLCFGLCDMGMGPELGMVAMDDLLNIEGPHGLRVERDKFFEGTVGDARKLAS